MPVPGKREVQSRVAELRVAAAQGGFWARVGAWWLRGKLRKLVLAGGLTLLLYSAYAVDYLDFALGTDALPSFVKRLIQGPIHTVQTKVVKLRVDEVLTHPQWGPCLSHVPPACADGASRRMWGLLTVEVRSSQRLKDRITIVCQVANSLGSVAGSVRHTFYARERPEKAFPEGSLSRIELGFTWDPEWVRILDRRPAELKGSCEVTQAR